MLTKRFTIILLFISMLFCQLALARQTPTPTSSRTHVRGASVHNNSRRRRRSVPVTTGRSYINVDGERIPSPVHAKSAPSGASAKCGDGTYSFSKHQQGTCSHHGGVAQWL
jgi:hypothetical protein